MMTTQKSHVNPASHKFLSGALVCFLTFFTFVVPGNAATSIPAPGPIGFVSVTPAVPLAIGPFTDEDPPSFGAPRFDPKQPSFDVTPNEPQQPNDLSQENFGNSPSGPLAPGFNDPANVPNPQVFADPHQAPNPPIFEDLPGFATAPNAPVPPGDLTQPILDTPREPQQPGDPPQESFDNVPGSLLPQGFAFPAGLPNPQTFAGSLTASMPPGLIGVAGGAKHPSDPVSQDFPNTWDAPALLSFIVPAEPANPLSSTISVNSTLPATAPQSFSIEPGSPLPPNFTDPQRIAVPQNTVLPPGGSLPTSFAPQLNIPALASFAFPLRLASPAQSPSPFGVAPVTSLALPVSLRFNDATTLNPNWQPQQDTSDFLFSFGPDNRSIYYTEYSDSQGVIAGKRYQLTRETKELVIYSKDENVRATVEPGQVVRILAKVVSGETLWVFVGTPYHPGVVYARTYAYGSTEKLREFNANTGDAYRMYFVKNYGDTILDMGYADYAKIAGTDGEVTITVKKGGDPRSLKTIQTITLSYK